MIHRDSRRAAKDYAASRRIGADGLRPLVTTILGVVDEDAVEFGGVADKIESVARRTRRQVHGERTEAEATRLRNEQGGRERLAAVAGSDYPCALALEFSCPTPEIGDIALEIHVRHDERSVG